LRGLAGVGGFRLGLRCPDEAARRMGLERLFPLAPLLNPMVGPSRASSHETSLLLLPSLCVAMPLCEGCVGFGESDGLRGWEALVGSEGFGADGSVSFFVGDLAAPVTDFLSAEVWVSKSALGSLFLFLGLRLP